MSLYLKYRPQTFKHLVGQDHISTTLINALKKNNLSHAYIYCGPRGTGKTSTARLIAKCLNCEKPDKNNEPCNKCNTCQDSNKGRLIDLIEIDAASNRGIDEIRDLKEKIKFAPTRSNKKVYIIDEVHMLTKEAFNALLKTLEEPPDHAHFILATTEIHKVPETIISRCQRFDFKRIAPAHIVQRLTYIAKEEKIEADEAALQIIANVANGGLRDAIGLLEQLSSESKITEVYVNNALGLSDNTAGTKLYNELIRKNKLEALNIIEGIYNNGIDLYEFTKNFIHFLRSKMHELIKSNENPSQIIDLIDNFTKASQDLKSSIIPQLPLELAIVKTLIKTQDIQTPASAEKPKTTTEKTPPIQQTPPPTIQPKPQNSETQRQQRPIKSKELQKNETPPKETETPTISKELSLDQIKSDWTRVVEQIKRPAIKLSLKEGYPTDLNGNKLIIHFSSKFHLDRLNNSETIGMIETAITQVFEQKLIFVPELGEMKIKPLTTETSDTTSNEGDLATQAMDIFGGTIL